MHMYNKMNEGLASFLQFNLLDIVDTLYLTNLTISNNTDMDVN